LLQEQEPYIGFLTIKRREVDRETRAAVKERRSR